MALIQGFASGLFMRAAIDGAVKERNAPPIVILNSSQDTNQHRVLSSDEFRVTMDILLFRLNPLIWQAGCKGMSVSVWTERYACWGR